MGGEVKKEFILDGLSCASCADKMEDKIKNIYGVKSVTVDFIGQKVIIEADSKFDIKNIINDAIKIIKSIEPNVKVTLKKNSSGDSMKENDEENDEDNYKIEFIKLVISGALFLIGLIFKFQNWLELTIFLISYIIVGEKVILSALKGVARGKVFGEHFLMSVATIGAFLIGEYPESVAVMLFYLIGEMLEDLAVNHSRKSISALMDIKPDYANLKVNDVIKKVTPDTVKIGDVIVVKPGEKVPLDGKVIKGNSMVNTAALTGESIPRELRPGCDALSGFINENGVLTIKVTKKFGESTVSKILDLVQNAGSKKAPTEKFITKFARYYTPVVVFGALALAVIPPLIIHGASFSDWIYRALVFLVVSCPCALVLSIPLGFIGGIGGASKRGILVKGGNYLEALNNVEAVAFDKTGTLTKGVFKVTGINPQNGFTAAQLIESAAYAESYSNHPIAISIISAYNKKIDKSRIEKCQELVGRGTKVIVNGKEVIAGNTKLMDSENINYNDSDSFGTMVHVAIDKKYAGNIIISDEIKEDSRKAIKEIKDIGIEKTVMLTGDSKVVADKIGNMLGIDMIFSELLPTDKVEKIESLEAKKSQKRKIVFVGDGINDAPVLALADIGIAMGGLGSDAAIEAADIVIMTDEPSKIASAIKVAKRTRSIVFQNIVFALGVKAVFLILGALGLASMWKAVFADMGVAIIAVLNAMRTLDTKKL